MLPSVSRAGPAMSAGSPVVRISRVGVRAAT